MTKYLLLLISAILFASCNKENIVTPTDPVSNYSKVLTIDSANVKIEMYNENSSILYVGYNEIGFKIFSNNVELKTGFLKYAPIMFHTSGPGHSTPVQSEFTYDNSKGMFTGYVCYSMLSDSSTSFWFADYNYNNEFYFKRKQFDVVLGTGNQMRIWFDAVNNVLYYLTLITPKDPKVGLNDFKIILHKTIDQSSYTEVSNAQMFIRPWMPSHGHGSSSNVNPVFTSYGKYEGKANFTMPGQWFVYDSIVVNNQTISTPFLYLVFDAR
ncbi:MAG: FixH family protein [Ignavibacteria bacterium]